MDNGQFEVYTKPINEGRRRYRCTRIKDDTEFVASFKALEFHKRDIPVRTERLLAISHDNLLKAVHKFIFNDNEGILHGGKCEKIVTIYETYKGMRAFIYFLERIHDRVVKGKVDREL